jgi:hypothetical protein
MTDDDPKKMAKAELESALKRASTVVAAYGVVLEAAGEPGILFHPESDLPFTKEKIRQSIELLLLIPTDDARRNNLEVVDVLLDNFVPDEDFGVVRQQQGGLSQALTNMNSGGKMDALQLAKIVSSGVTPEGQSQLRQIQDRVKCNNQTTLARHKELRLEADRLRKAMA